MMGFDQVAGPLAYCFDEAVWLFGSWVDSRLEETVPVKKNGDVVGQRPKYRLGQLLGTEKPKKISEDAIKSMFGKRARRLD